MIYLYLFLREWFLRPLLDMRAINARLDAVAYLSHPSNSEILFELGEHLKEVKDIAAITNRIR
jgi:DNA mismatch repair ATPase MutS